MVQVDSMLTEMKFAYQDPEAIRLIVTKRSGTQRNGTSMRPKDIRIYVCTAIITKKYIVASETIVRTNAENLSALLLRYVYQAMTRNADSSRCAPRSVIGFYANDQNQRSDAPNAAPNELGTNMSRRSTTIAHILKASTGIGRNSTNVGGLTKAVASAIANLANVRVPKYTARILFLKVIAYTLGRGRIGWRSDFGTNDTPQHDEYIRRKQENRDCDYLDVVQSVTPREG